MPAIPRRCLIDGPFIDLSNISDLLYYDSIICSDKKLTIINPFNNNKIIDKLLENGLILKRCSVFNKTDLDIFENKYPSFGEMKTAARPLTERGKINRALANLAYEYKIKATPKYYLPEFNAISQTGKTEVLSVLISQFPKVHPSKLDIKKFIDFLCDNETIEKKNRLFSWQCQIERELKKGTINTNEIYELMESELDKYITWLNLHIKDTKYSVIYSEILEIVLGIALIYFKQPILGIASLGKGLITFQKRNIDLNKQELSAPGYELAYIVHAERNLKNIIK